MDGNTERLPCCHSGVRRQASSASSRQPDAPSPAIVLETPRQRRTSLARARGRLWRQWSGSSLFVDSFSQSGRRQRGTSVKGAGLIVALLQPDQELNLCEHRAGLRVVCGEMAPPRQGWCGLNRNARLMVAGRGHSYRWQPSRRRSTQTISAARWCSRSERRSRSPVMEFSAAPIEFNGSASVS